MRKTFLMILALVTIASAAFAGGQTSSSTASGPRYPATVDPFGKYDTTVALTFAKATNAATDFPAGDSWGNNIWTREVLKDLNIKLVLAWEAEAVNQYDTKLNLAIASNDLTDAIYLRNATQFQRLVDAGKLEDLTEAYEKFAYPQLKTWFTEDGGIRKRWGTVGGRLYGISVSGVNYQQTRMLFIRRDWMQQLHLAAPKSMDDVLEIARKFKAVDPAHRYGILITKDILDNSMSDMNLIANSLGAYPRRWIVGSGGKLIYGSVQPAMKETLKVYRDLYANGLINPEFATTDGGASAAQLTNSMVGVAPNGSWLYSWPLNSLYESEGAEWDCYPGMPMKGHEKDFKLQVDPVRREFVVVRKGYANPEALLKVLNYEAYKINDPKGAEQRFHSDEKYGYHMYMPFYPPFGPTKVNFETQPHVTNAIDKKDESYLVTPHDKLQYGRVKAYLEAVAAGKKPAAGDWVAYNGFYGPKSAFAVLNYYFEKNLYYVDPVSGIETPEMARKQQTLNKLEEQYYVEIITGKKPLDAFDQWVKDWRELGGGQIETEINAWYKSVK